MSLNSEDELILNRLFMSKSIKDIPNFSNSKIVLLFILSVVLAFSCRKPTDNTNPIPEIEFLNFEAKSDTGVFTLSFKDGDGDVGLRPSDTTGDFHFSSEFYNNLFFEYYEKHDFNGWIPGRNFFGDTIIHGYRLPFLEPNGKEKNLQGEIQITLEPRYYNPNSNNSDTIKFVIYLYDRALNKSNEVETFEIIRTL